MDIPLLRGTKRRILRLLRRGVLTADEIAEPLEVTPNAVRFHLTEMERDGLVEQRPVRRGPRKPSSGFSLTEAGDALFPKRYGELLNAVLHDVRDGRSAAEVEALFRRLGHRLAAEQRGRFEALPREGRIAEALRFLEELGGAAQLSADPAAPDRVTVVGQSCPFKAIVPQHPEICALLETFLVEVLPGATVCETCQKEGTPHCRFEVVANQA